MAKGTYHVLIGARSIDKGNASVKELQSKGYEGTCEVLQIDQTDDDSIAAAAKRVESTHGHLDVLINNAAIASEEHTREAMISNLSTNAAGPYFLTHAFRPLLLKTKASTARVIQVSSGMGSVSIKLDHSNWVAPIPALPYRASKAALHMVTAQLVYEFKDDNIKFFTVCPGFTVSNLGAQNRVENGAKPTDEAVRPLVKIVEGERDDEATKFLHADGQYDW